MRKGNFCAVGLHVHALYIYNCYLHLHNTWVFKIHWSWQVFPSLEFRSVSSPHMILLLGTHKAVHSQGQDLVTPRAPDYWKPGDFKAELQLKQLNHFWNTNTDAILPAKGLVYMCIQSWDIPSPARHQKQVGNLTFSSAACPSSHPSAVSPCQHVPY